jgi:hypothetical protein
MGLLDMLGGLGTTPPSYMESLLGAQDTEDLRKRSIGSGLVNALIGYAAAPKNQNLGLGRILASAAQSGLQGARGVYDTATQDAINQARIEEMKRAKDMQLRKDAFISNIGKPNATRQVVTPSEMQEPVPVEAGAEAPSFATQPTAPMVTEESFYDPNVMLQQALSSGALDLKDYLTITSRQKQGTQLLSNNDIEKLKTEGFELPTDRGQRYQRDIDTGKIDLIEGTLKPKEPSFKVGEIQEFKQAGKDITREYQGNNQWKVIAVSDRNQDFVGVEFLSPEATAKAAAIYNLSGGTLPPIARSKAGQQTIKNILNTAALMDAGKSPTEAATTVLSNKQNRAAEQQTIKSFSGGIEGRSVRAMNTATDHLFTLQEAANALKNNDIRLFNTIGNKINKEIGVAAPVSFEGVKKIVAGEIVKATTGSAGALGDREEVAATINAANSPDQLLEQIEYFKKLMAGQLDSLELQFITGTNRKSSEFRQRLSPRTKQILSPSADKSEDLPSRQSPSSDSVATTSGALPAISPNPNEKGWVLKVDKSTGTRAYVNPENNKQYRIVP